MLRCLLAVLAVSAPVSAARAQSADATALFLLAQRQGLAPDARGEVVLGSEVSSGSGDAADHVRVEALFRATAPCRYLLQVLRRRIVGGSPAGEDWSQIRVDFGKADHLVFKPLYDDHGPSTYLMLGRPGLMCVRDAIMADCSDRITVEEDPQHAFDHAAIEQAFDRMHGALCPEQPS